jgi:membrane protein
MEHSTDRVFKAPPQDPPRGFWGALMADLNEDDVPALAASIAYYTTLSLSPVMLLGLTVIGTMVPSAQEKFIAEAAGLVGAQGEGVIRSIVESARDQPDLRHAAGWVGIGVLLFGATAVFGQLQFSLNRIWDLENRALKGLAGFIRRRVLSIGLLASVLFLTIVSFLMQAAFNAVPWFQQGPLAIVWFAVSFLLYSALFSALYRWLPDRRIPWLTAIRGGLLTAVLFQVGRYLIGIYLGHSTAAGAFGPAGALVVWLIWAYYSALIFLVSAEILFELAHHRGWEWWEPVSPDAVEVTDR